MSRREDLNLLHRRIKKAKKKVRKLKASTAKMREEMIQFTNLAEKRHQGIVQAREAIHPLILAAELLNAQVLEFISDWLAKNDGY